MWDCLFLFVCLYIYTYTYIHTLLVVFKKNRKIWCHIRMYNFKTELIKFTFWCEDATVWPAGEYQNYTLYNLLLSMISSLHGRLAMNSHWIVEKVCHSKVILNQSFQCERKHFIPLISFQKSMFLCLFLLDDKGFAV